MILEIDLEDLVWRISNETYIFLIFIDDLHGYHQSEHPPLAQEFQNKVIIYTMRAKLLKTLQGYILCKILWWGGGVTAWGKKIKSRFMGQKI